MRAARVSVVVCVALVAAMVPAQPGGASVLSTADQIEQIAPPPSVMPNALTGPSIKLFEERQGVTLMAPLKIDLNAPGTYATSSDLPTGLAKLPVGALIDSHFLHAESRSGASAVFEGTVTFAEPIVGVAVRAGTLSQSDYLGAPGTQYPTGKSLRQLELGSDVVTVLPDGKSLRLRSSSGSAYDQVRVFTQPVVTATLTSDRAAVGAGTATVPLENIPSSALDREQRPRHHEVRSVQLGAARRDPRCAGLISPNPRCVGWRCVAWRCVASVSGRSGSTRFF